jgi:DNA recombination protein RmuC
METWIIILIATIVGAVISFLSTLLVMQKRQKKLSSKVDVLNMQLETSKASAEAEKEQWQRLLDETKENAEKTVQDIKAESQCRIEKEEEDAKERITEVKKEWAERLESYKTEAENRLTNVLAEKEKDFNEKLAEKEKDYNEKLADKERYSEELRQEQETRHKQALESQKDSFKQAMSDLSAKMKETTDGLLKQRQEEFASISSSSIGQIVNPLKETIDKMKKAMDDGVLKQTELGGELKTYVDTIRKQSEATRESAKELTNAFKYGSKVQGDWGEMVLERLLADQGLTEEVDFEVQSCVQDENGKTYRPDVILHFNDDRDIIIDSKVSLTAFMNFVNAENEDDRNKYLKDHIKSIKSHVTELSKKDYSSYIKPPKVKTDFVIMFVPHSGALWTAINNEPGLWRDAMEQNVFIADEQTLYAALRTIKLTWIQVKQAQNQEKVFKLADEMINRVESFLESYEAIGKSLQSAQDAFEKGQKKLAPDGHSIRTTCQQLIDLGAKAKKKISKGKKEPYPSISKSDSPALGSAGIIDAESEEITDVDALVSKEI